MKNQLWYDVQDQLIAERAAMREAAASQGVPPTLSPAIVGQVTQHGASTTLVASSLSRSYDVMEGEEPQGGGEAAVYDEAHEDEADALPIGSATWYPGHDVEVITLTGDDVATFDRLYGPPRLTWLERIAKRWPIRVA